MAQTIDPFINDQYTNVQLRLIRQRLDEQRLRAESRGTVSDDGRSEVSQLSPRVRLQQSMLKRQQLLDSIKNEDRLAGNLRRPLSTTGYKTPDPPPSRLSLPDYTGHRQDRHQSRPHRSRDQHYYYIYKDPKYSYRNDPQSHYNYNSQNRPPRPQSYLQPIPQYQAPQAALPQPSLPHTQMLPVPQPYIFNTAGEAAKNPSSTKQDMMEMMMLQNAQTHQMIMSQLMISSLPKQHEKNVSLDELYKLKEPKRPPSVHHHHYDSSSRLPAINTQPNRPYPAEVAPLKQPVSKPRKKVPKPKRRNTVDWRAFQPIVPVEAPKKKFQYRELPFPGPRPLRRFRHVAYAAYFTKLLNKAITSPTFKRPLPLNPDKVFAIRLKEIVAALHYVYLNPLGKTKQILDTITAFNCKDLSTALKYEPPSKQQTEITDDVAFIIENIAFEITEIMPLTGVLGTHRKADVYHLLKPGNLFPNGYLWDIESNVLQFDDNGRTTNITDDKAFILMAGAFLGRGIITTLLLKPVEYGLLEHLPTYVAEQNLRLLATLFTYLLRRLYSSTEQPLDIPDVIGRFLYTDAECDHLIRKLKNSFEYCLKIFDTWGKEYVKRLRTIQRIEEGKLYP